MEQKHTQYDRLCAHTTDRTMPWKPQTLAHIQNLRNLTTRWLSSFQHCLFFPQQREKVSLVSEA